MNAPFLLGIQVIKHLATEPKAGRPKQTGEQEAKTVGWTWSQVKGESDGWVQLRSYAPLGLKQGQTSYHAKYFQTMMFKKKST